MLFDFFCEDYFFWEIYDFFCEDYFFWEIYFL